MLHRILKQYPIILFDIKMYKAISYKFFRKGIRKYKNVLHKYSFDH